MTRVTFTRAGLIGMALLIAACSSDSNNAADGGVIDVNGCLGTTVCGADYPCQYLQTSSSDYTCRGQFADWTPTDSPATFMDFGNGTVTDSRNGLVWQQVVDAGTYTWQDAKTYCAGLSLAGTGWRLPTRAELESIVDFGAYDPAIDTITFPETPADGFWSASTWVTDSSDAWIIYFFDGKSGLTDAAKEYRVRCVRSDSGTPSAGSGGAPPGRYTVNNGTVYDNRTQLTWQRAVDPRKYGQTAAADYCTDLSLAGTGWRLPKISELLTLVDPTQTRPTIDAAAFPKTPLDAFWSSSPFVGSKYNDVWNVYFGPGYSIYLYPGDSLFVRCVR